MELTLTQEDIATLKQIAKEVADKDYFTLNEAEFSSDGTASIEVTYECLVDTAHELADLRDYAFNELVKSQRYSKSDILEYLYENDLDDDFRNNIHYDLHGLFKTRLEENFGSWTVDTLNKFIDEIELCVYFDLNDYASTMEDILKTALNDANQYLEFEDLRNDYILEAVRAGDEIYVFASIEDAHNLVVRRTSADGAEMSRFLYDHSIYRSEEEYSDDDLAEIIIDLGLAEEFAEYWPEEYPIIKVHSGYAVNYEVL